MTDIVPKEASTLTQYHLPEGSNWMSESFTEDGIKLRDYWQIVMKHKWLILAIVFTVMAGVAIQTFSTTPVYKSTATIQIDPEAASLLPYQTGMFDPSLRIEPYLRTKYNILRSHAMSRRVAKRLALSGHSLFSATPEHNLLRNAVSFLKTRISHTFQASSRIAEDQLKSEARMADQIRGNLEVKPVSGTRVVEISYVSSSPQLATIVVNTLAEEAIEENFESQYEASKRATEFLEKQLLNMKIKVEKSEEELIHYARLNNLFNIDQGQNVTMEKLAYLTNEMTKAEAELIFKTVQKGVIGNATVENFPQILKTATITNLEARLFQLEQELGSLSTKFGPEWPEILQVKEQVSKVQEQLLNEKENAIGQAEFEYQATLERVRMLSGALKQQQAQAEQLSQDSIQYNILKREVETNKQLYDGLLQRLKQVGVSESLASSNVRIVDHAEIPTSIYRPQTHLNLILGLAVGLILGLGLAFMSEFLDNTLKTPDDLEKFVALPSLGFVPTINQLSGKKEPLHLLPEQTETGPLLRSDPWLRSQAWEAYRSLRTSILLSHPGKPPQKILFTSALPKEGKTTTVVNTAIVLAQTGARTIIVEADMRKPVISNLLGINGDQGMSTFLSGNTDLASQIRQTRIPNLFVLPGGTVPPNPTELLGSVRMVRAFALLSEYFKYIIIDTPPALFVADALVLCPHVDGTVLVIHAGETPREAVKKAKVRLLGVGAKILGAMINNVNIQKPEFSYYYQYYRGYEYYREDNFHSGS